jgi:hypothetical protein
MRRRKIIVILLFTVAHFGLLVLAIASSFRIFSGPSTAAEIFWDQVVHVLLFPAIIVLPGVQNGVVQSILWGLNSILWGIVLGVTYIKLRKPRRTISKGNE